MRNSRAKASALSLVRLATALTTTALDGATDVQNMRAMLAAPSTPMRSRDDAVIRSPPSFVERAWARARQSGRTRQGSESAAVTSADGARILAALGWE